MGALIDLTGKRFTRLLVVKRVGNDKWGNPRWFCLCDCGNIKIVLGEYLRNGDTKSCGCLCGEAHGMSKTPEYIAWQDAKTRCGNFNTRDYKNYGGRGIKMCKRWLNSFKAFFMDMGKRPGSGYTLERVNNDFGYFKENCKWSTRKEQANNRRFTSRCRIFKAVSIIGRVYISRNQTRFARDHNLSRASISRCLLGKYKQHRGWTFEFTGGN